MAQVKPGYYQEIFYFRMPLLTDQNQVFKKPCNKSGSKADHVDV